MPIKCIDFARQIKDNNRQSHGNRNNYSQSSYLLPEKQQNPVGFSQTSKAVNVPIQAPVAY